MTDHDIISRARDIGHKIAANNYKADAASWVMYGAALAYGSSISRGSNRYNKWIIDNGLNMIPGNYRSCAKRVFLNWRFVEHLTRDGGSLYGVNDIGKIYNACVALSKGSDKDGGSVDYEIHNGVDPAVVVDAIDEIARISAIMHHDAQCATSLLMVMDSLSSAVINSIKD